MQIYYACVLTIYDCAAVWWQREMELAITNDEEGVERTEGVPSTILEISIVIRLQKMARMNFYRKSAGDLQEVLQEQAERDF